MNFAQYKRKRALVEEAHRRHCITEKCKCSLLGILNTQLRREGEAAIEELRIEAERNRVRAALAPLSESLSLGGGL